MRDVAEIQADLDALKAGGGDLRSTKAKLLREEMKAASAPLDETSPVVPAFASGDTAFINDALAQLMLKGRGAGKLEQAYSDIRSILKVKHLLEDAAGLMPVGRIDLPHWDTLGRERDTGEKFDAKTLAAARASGSTPQAVVDGTAQRAIPQPKVVVTDPATSIRGRDGEPINFKRTRTLNEPDQSATFLSDAESEAVATSK